MLPSDGTSRVPSWQEALHHEIEDARLLLDFSVQEGLAVSDSILTDIKDATTWIVLEEGSSPPRLPNGEPLTVEKRVVFERAYRDLAQLTEPVTAATLRFTSDRFGRTARLIAIRKISEGKIWARKLGIYTTLLLVAILGIENYSNILEAYYPADPASSGNVSLLHMISLVLESLEPFLYGALGSVTYLLKSAHIFIHTRCFDKLRIPEYYNRLLLGMIAGGAIKLLITGIANDDGQIVELSAAAVAFIAGYNNELLFSSIERVSAALLPKVGVETMKRAGPDGPTTAMVHSLLERLKNATNDAERQAVQKLLDRLIK